MAPASIAFRVAFRVAFPVARLVAPLVALAACRVPARRDPAPRAELAADARDRMHVRFAAAQAIEVAIGVDDLDRAHAEAQRLAAMDEPALAPRWRHYLDDVRAAAAQVVASPDAVKAASATAQLGRTCARCHEATWARVAFPPRPAPVESGKLGPQMASHQWAAARMWEGLVGPSDDRWLAGARTLAASPLTITAESGALGIADDVAATRALADRARSLADHDQRARLYGELLATCARCHARIRDR